MSTVRLTCPCCRVVGACDCNWAVPLAGRDFSYGFCRTCQKCPKHCPCEGAAPLINEPVKTMQELVEIKPLEVFRLRQLLKRAYQALEQAARGEKRTGGTQLGSVDGRYGRTEERDGRMKELVILIGLPRSGKTTWAMQQGCPIVCPDAIRLALHGQAFYPDAEPMVWALAELMVAALFGAGHDTVILDACNVTAKRSKPWSDWASKHGVIPSFHLVDTPAAVCRERAAASGRPELLPVIDRMVAETDIPELREVGE